jgi:excisionase family DNA binding protein
MSCKLFTRKEAAELLRSSTWHLDNLIRLGRLKAVNIGNGPKKPRVLIPESAIQEFLQSTQINPPAKTPPKKRVAKAGHINFF